MIPVNAPRFCRIVCHNEREWEFVEALHARAEAGGWSADSWPRDDRVLLSFCPYDNDPDYNNVLRTLRVDCNGHVLWCGLDETHQFVTDPILDATLPGRTTVHTPADSANEAADWLEREMRRSIVRHEWDRLDARGVALRQWVMADTGEVIVLRGRRTPDFGPPDRIVPAWG